MLQREAPLPLKSWEQDHLLYLHASEDEALLRQFDRHLASLKREGLIESWHEGLIPAGGAIALNLGDRLRQATMVLLLISSDFLASERHLEFVVRAMEEHRQRNIAVVAVLARPVDWRPDLLGSLFTLPHDGQAVTLWENRDAAWVDVVHGIRHVLRGGILPAPVVTPPRSTLDVKISVTDLLRAYRDGLSALHERWDLRMARSAERGSARRLIAPMLDDIYLPLRLARGYDSNKTEEGDSLEPQELLRREQPLAIRGPAGSGKTTWMRWTFRRLLQRGDALPLPIVLRDVARRWLHPDCKGELRSIEHFLGDWVEEHVPGGRGLVGRLLADSPAQGPRPVLLVDGWDELGDLGEEFRGKLLGLMRRYPALLVVASSRPYGEGRPAQSDGFEVLDIQPLSDAEIDGFAETYFRVCYGADQRVVTEERGRFGRALERSPEARSLARTALLLTMMLLISRSQALPDKRHLLYEKCIESLLTALPKRREEEGVQGLPDQWRPGDSVQRMSAVAKLALTFQTQGYEQQHRSSIVATWNELAASLPQAWTRQQREGFVEWLAGPGGLLTDRSDGTLVFSHLSFQEYLSAWQLGNTEEDPQAQLVAFNERVGNSNWWETLLLWAALLGDKSQARLDVLLQEVVLANPDAGLTLVGMALADGLGSQDRFLSWLEVARGALAWRWPYSFDLCARAWRTSQQDQRRQQISDTLTAAAGGMRWFGRLQVEAVIEDLGRTDALALPQPGSLAAHMETARPSEVTAGRVAVERILYAWSGQVPETPVELSHLQSWPGRRRKAGLRLQCAAVFGADRADLVRMASKVLVEDDFVALHKTLTRQGFGKGQVRNFVRSYHGNFAWSHMENFVRDFDPHQVSVWIECYAMFELTRAALELQPSWFTLPAAPPDPLWPALARHSQRCATASDRELLEDLVRCPDHRSAPLAWGLQYIVRGDVLLDDSTVVTLDQLADEAGVPRLPYLEDMAPGRDSPRPV